MKKSIYLLMVVSAINTIYMITMERKNEDEINRLEELIRLQNGMKVTATMYNP